MADYKKSLKILRHNYNGYLIINALQNNKFEMFDSDIYAMAKYIGVSIPFGQKHYIFDNFDDVIKSLQTTRKYSFIVIKNNKLYMRVVSDKKKRKIAKRQQEKEDYKNTLNNIIRNREDKKPYNDNKPTPVNNNINKEKSGKIPKIYKGSKGQYTVYVDKEPAKKKLTQAEKYDLKLSKGCLVRCCRCRNFVSDFFEFNSGKCLCLDCLNKLSDKQMEEELKRPYDKKYTMWSSIVKVYQGGQP